MSRWRDEEWRKDMKISFDFNHMMSESVGKADGLTASEVEALVPKARDIHEELSARRRSGDLPFFDLPYQETGPIKELADWVAGTSDNFVLLGIGGSALGPIALQSGLRHPFHNLVDSAARGGRPRMFFADNVDPDHFTAMLDMLDMKMTVFDVVTKSGGTAETMAGFMAARQRVTDSLGKSALKDHFIAVTDPAKGGLRKIVNDEGYRALDVPPGVGGRFSVFTPVGLLPAAVSGIDIDELLAGAAFMDRLTSLSGLWENPAYMASALQYIADTKKGKRVCVMMPYSNALKDVADWFRQLWAESLGKRLDLEGNEVNTGQTPVNALGATDQHSQVQLYMEGPNDKTFTFIRVGRFREQVAIPRSYGDMEGIGYLGGKTMAELINAEQSATEAALVKAGRPCCRITVPEVNAFTMGQLLYMFEVMTAFSGGLYGIDPFDQPGVEEGKLLTYAMMGRPGFEGKKKELDNLSGGRDRYIL